MLLGWDGRLEETGAPTCLQSCSTQALSLNLKSGTPDRFCRGFGGRAWGLGFEGSGKMDNIERPKDLKNKV